LCGIANALNAAVNLLMLEPGGAFGLRRFALPGAVWDMGMLAVAAGGCAVAAGLWTSLRDHSWLLAMHGLALGTFGLIGLSPLVRGPLSFRPVSLVFVVMAVSIGVFALATARRLRGSALDMAILTVAGAVSLGFAFSFFAVGFHWVTLGPRSFWIWMALYFGFPRCSCYGWRFAGTAVLRSTPARRKPCHHCQDHDTRIKQPSVPGFTHHSA